MKSFRSAFLSGIAASLAMLLVVSCNNPEINATAPDPQSINGQSLGKVSASGPSMSAAALDRVVAAQNRHTPHLLEISGVVGTGAGLDAAGNPAVLVLVERAGMTGVPSQVDGTPVSVVVTGRIETLATCPLNSVTRTARFTRPVPIGVSTGHPLITAGTIGVRVKNAAGQLFALSNNHVYANVNQGPIGVNVLQAGPYDGGVNHVDSIGRLSAYRTISFCKGNRCTANTIDAAIASTTASLVGNSTPCDGYGTPSSATVLPSVGLGVMKYGRTTGQTSSTISAVNVSVKVSFGNGKTALFTGQVLINSTGFSAGGDSGSLIVSGTGNPVALLFAGSSSTTIGNPIGAVLSYFNVTIDGV